MRLTTGVVQAEADINQDGIVNFLDIAPFIQVLTQSWGIRRDVQESKTQRLRGHWEIGRVSSVPFVLGSSGFLVASSSKKLQ